MIKTVFIVDDTLIHDIDEPLQLAVGSRVVHNDIAYTVTRTIIRLIPRQPMVKNTAVIKTYLERENPFA